MTCLSCLSCLGDVVYAALPEEGQEVTAGEECGALGQLLRPYLPSSQINYCFFQFGPVGSAKILYLEWQQINDL